MTLDELYGKVIADEALKAEMAAAVADGKIVEWVAGQGIETTLEELTAYAEAAAAKEEKLSLDDVDKVAGGSYITSGKTLFPIQCG